MSQKSTTPSPPLNLDVQLLYPPIGIVSAVALAISEEAMDVDTGRVMLAHLSEVEIAFSHRTPDRTAYQRITARVSGHSKGITTLSFLHCGGDAHRTLQELVTSSPAS